MMSLIDLDDDQRWVPTHVNVTVLRARGLRTKGKHGSRYLYTIIHVAKEKFTTGLVEKAAVPEWNEECCFELLPGILEAGGRSAYPPGSGDLVLTVMHRVLIGLDVFLGQATIPLDKIFHDGMCPRDEWLKLNSKAGRKEKERGELQVTVQFTRNNMTASMFDLTMKDKPRSAFGKLKDRVTGRKRADQESSSAIVPGRYAALSGNLGQTFEDGGGGGLGGGVESGDTEVAEEKRSKMKDFFKGKLRRSSDTKSCSSLASESSVSSVASDSPGPPPSLDLLADPPTSPIYSSKVKVDNHYGETDLAKKVLTTQHNTKIMTHKRASSDGASKVTTPLPRSSPTVESLKGQTMTQSKSSLCINGSHVYDSEPSTPKSTGALPSKLVLLEKCSPLSRSLQNLTKRSEDKGSPGESRRWSFDKVKKEEKDEEKEAEPAATQLRSAQAVGGRPVQDAAPVLPSDSPDKGKKLRKTLFSGGRSDSLPAKTESGQASEGRLRGWFGSSDSHNKPRLEVSPKVESSSDAPPPLPPRSPVPPQCSSPSTFSAGSPDSGNHTNPFTPSSSPSPTPLSPSNPFLPRMQRNPFFEELITEELRRSPPLLPRSPSVSSRFRYTASASQPHAPGDTTQREAASIRRERPRPVARQISLPALLPRTATSSPPNHSTPRSMSESAGEWDDSFDAFASSRLNTPKGTAAQKALRTAPTAPRTSHMPPVDNHAMNPIEESRGFEVDPPPLPPRRLLRTPVSEIHSDSWLHRGQELAVHKEACLLSQAGVACLQRAREGERKRNTQSLSPDPHTTSDTSDSLTQPSTNVTSPIFISEDKLKKFKYEPLEDESDFWKGMLFEQDLYGTVAAGNYGEPKVNNILLSLASEETVTSKSITHCQQADLVEPKMLLDSKMSVSDMLSMSSSNPSKSNTIAFDSASSKPESTADSSLIKPGQPTHDNISSSLTLEDLNMNVHDSDFTFIDSDGSSPSEVVDTLKGLGRILPKPSEDSPIAVYHEAMTAPEDMFTLTNTSIPESSSSFEMMTSTLCQDNCQDNGCDQNNAVPNREFTLNKKDTPENQPSYQPDVETEAGRDTTGRIENLKSTQGALDDNGNPRAKQAPPQKQQSPPRVFSARLRRKGVTQNNFDGGSNGPTNMEQKKCDQLVSTVPNISDTSEGPFSYQPTKSPMSNKRTALVTESLNKDRVDHNESNTKPLMSSKGDTGSIQSTCTGSCVTENPSSKQPEEMSFEDLHAKVAPNLRSVSKSKISLPLQESNPCASILPPALSLPAAANSQAKQHPTLVFSPSMHPPTGFSATLAVAPYTSSSSSSSFSTSAQPPVDARHTLLPEETQPASNLPHQESSPHPVKPLTTTANQAEKKEGRSVLEKLKSTIHPGRAAQHSVVEAEKSQVARVDTSAQYQHLTNMELISLLLQQEVDMEEQQASCDQQEALLAKREAELKKVKNQVRDLEDYIDNLLLRIMEQTPTLLQVRGRHK